MTDPERSSISSGFAVPQWIRSKTDRNDYDVNFSPPPHDDSFFYIRYPVQDKPRTTIKNLSEKIQEDTKNHNFASKAALFSNHTEPCKKFMNESNVDGVKHPPKSFGTDDGFQGSNAACGSSIIEVAQRMVSGRSFHSNRGLQVSNVDQDEFESFQLKTVEDQTLKTSSLIKPEPYELEAQQAKNRLLIRRGSKSLPSSPLGSPKSMRKFQANPYFTGTFTLANQNTEGRGWFLASLLGIQREATPSSSIHHIDEEPENFNNDNVEQSDNAKNLHTKILKAKPSELREMNFWSPTSM
ncbi:uncharacterized protein LOC129606308 [Condylostylus longicornis]|uniref:uncharacterized protein LOC129606308 n=1 Tax=Condylostylus longicornis TaxID=2530218 RepID=UPI00244DE17F|nr:uncharacterized protein LOC129606308 [Condylostylus longicornis]